MNDDTNRTSAAVDALRDAYLHTKAQLFPFRFDSWLALGFVAFLDQCGRQGGVGAVRGLNLPPLSDGTGTGGRADLESARAWLGEHVLLVVAIAAGVLALVIGLIALITWLRSRATFVYIHNVTRGAAEIARPWREHREIASSFFVWHLVLAVGGLIVVLVLLAAIALSVLYLVASRNPLAFAGIVIPVLLVIAAAVAMALATLLFRDFVAPLQFQAGRPFGAALRTFGGLLRAQPLGFLVYVLLRVVFGLAAAFVMIAAMCLTCCCAALPVVNQTLLQPVYYFERSWSLFFLRRLGHDTFAVQPRLQPENEKP